MFNFTIGMTHETSINIQYFLSITAKTASLIDKINLTYDNLVNISKIESCVSKLPEFTFFLAPDAEKLDMGIKIHTENVKFFSPN